MPTLSSSSRRARLTAALAAIVLAPLCACDGGDAAPLDPDEWLPGGATTNTLLFGSNAFTRPAENITPEHALLFYSGNSAFNQSWVQAPASTTGHDGLGPVFNARSCAACHFKDGRGRPPERADEAFLGLLLRLSVPGSGPHGEPLPEPTYGGQLQPFAIGGVPAEGTPVVTWQEVPGTYADGTPYALLEPSYRIDALAYGPMDPEVRVSPRVAPATIGLGLLEAIPDARLAELEDPDDADGDGISGRRNRVWDVELEQVVTGRFGWKAEQPTIRQQSAGAFAGDIGITSPMFGADDCTEAQPDCRSAFAEEGPELDDALLDRVELYGRLLAVPSRQAHARPEVLRGKALFARAGCGGCHVASHRTSPDAALEELRDQKIWPYTDLLLHDMGEALSDGRPSFDAEGAEWRTPPLWGLRFNVTVNGHDRLLHDGRARGVAEAILWHGGEAEASREAFRALDASQRAALIAFVESL
ncbi:MAG: thiol oxidoreductase [Deltaproteobacteria bacterium]|nr:thiol oxidoreductase [Deltaproteobacteria bacterium]MCB9786666.1 thiol oxidoreductase [Deltaproteobacteria bacterium]